MYKELLNAAKMDRGQIQAVFLLTALNWFGIFVHGKDTTPELWASAILFWPLFVFTLNFVFNYYWGPAYESKN